MNVLAIGRAPQFSPQSVELDAAILGAVIERHVALDDNVKVIDEACLDADCLKMAERIYTMGRLKRTIQLLQECRHARVINRPEALMRCRRDEIECVMRRLHIPTAPEEGTDGYWLKRADQSAQTSKDVVYVPDRQALQKAIEEFRQRGISDYTVSAHVKGDLVKFYGVAGCGFFFCTYPTDDGRSKFGAERYNGDATHYPFCKAELKGEAERLAVAIGLEVYGGDAIVRADGSFCLIDFNDWPSFAPCREAAAEAIVMS